MNIPDKIKIGGMIFSVALIDNLMRDGSSSGRSCGNSQEIQIDKSASHQYKETTFIHEVLHQINFVYNIGLEHKQIYDLETAIYALVKDNPRVFNEKLTQNTIGIDANIDDDILVDDLVDRAINKFTTEFRKTLQDMKR
ncbi:hypothetical protein BS101_18015 [Clostridium kluyveri]|uniref:Uncharacterized protein n=1 Tax=Clostridium kluyveri TaxID=1534 RepID=A0A1L5FBV6_CLOKL|nr:hypothetical protein BS101_18015 [Clostridium kluyveri]